MNTPFKLMAGLAATLLGVCVSQAALTVYEPFNYPVGNLANSTAATGTGLTGSWTCGSAGTVSAGLSYTGLPVANNALSSGTGRQYVSLSTPLSSGTKYIGFLFKASGNMGGNIDGVYFPSDNATCLWFGFGLGPYSGTQGQLGIGSMTTAGTAALGATSLKQVGLGTYGSTYLIVLKIDFNTSGTSDTITIYTNPAANASAPGVAPAGTYSGYDVGTISKVGLNVQGGANITVDEIRVGDSYGDVVGYVAAPDAPTGLIATAGVNAVGLSWNAVSGATGYKVLRGTATGVYTATNNAASNTNYDITAVGGTTYYYAVQATNSSGASASSAEVSATPTIALPNPPTEVVAVGSNGVVNLTWRAATGAAGYNVKRSSASGAETTIAGVATTSYADTAVVNGALYFYTVCSTNAAGQSADSSEVSAAPNAPPAVPAGVIATGGSNQVTLTWTSSAGATSYNVKRSTTSGAGYVTIGTATTAGYTDVTAIKFTTYYYVVSAVSSYGESDNSSPETAATPTGAYGPGAYEAFNYPIGTLANNTASTASGFSGNWTVSGFPSIVAGLTYSNLPTSANAYQHSAAGSQTVVNFATALSSGTKYISFLFKGSGNSGGDSVGVFFKGDNAASLFAGFYSPYSATSTGFGLGSVNSTVLGGATGLGAPVAIDNTAVHFVVIKIDFNTSGANDTVSLWIDPLAGAAAPGVAANQVINTFDVGRISAFGINITGGYNPVIDEIRVGDVYGDVAGYGSVSAPIIPTTLVLTATQGEQISWIAGSANSYQVQQSADGSTWTNAGSMLIGSAVASIYQTNPAPFYRVLELTPGSISANQIPNGSFETTAANSTGALGWSGSANGVDANNNTNYVCVTNQWAGLAPVDGAGFLYMEGATPTTGASAAPNTSLQSDIYPILVPGAQYAVSWSAANPIKVGGANPQYHVQWFDKNNAFISEVWGSFASAGATWTIVSNSFTAPANAAGMSLGFMQAVGAGSGNDWVTLIDNVSVTCPGIGSTNVLTPSVQLGAAFTATVNTNGVLAGLASGTVRFQTNSAEFSTNVLAAGSAGSATAMLTPPYSVTAIYSGDSTYIGSTNTLTVAHAAAVLTLGNLNQIYDGTPKAVTVVTTPAGLLVNLTYNGSAVAPAAIGSYEVVATVVDPIFQGSATNTLVIGTDSYFGAGAGSVTLANGNAAVVLSGIEGLNYIVQRATNVQFTEGLRLFPTVTAPAGGNVSVNDDFSDLGTVPAAAFYRLQYVP